MDQGWLLSTLAQSAILAVIVGTVVKLLLDRTRPWYNRELTRNADSTIEELKSSAMRLESLQQQHNQAYSSLSGIVQLTLQSLISKQSALQYVASNIQDDSQAILEAAAFSRSTRIIGSCYDQLSIWLARNKFALESSEIYPASTRFHEELGRYDLYMFVLSIARNARSDEQAAAAIAELATSSETLTNIGQQLLQNLQAAVTVTHPSKA